MYISLQCMKDTDDIKRSGFFLNYFYKSIGNHISMSGLMTSFKDSPSTVRFLLLRELQLNDCQLLLCFQVSVTHFDDLLSCISPRRKKIKTRTTLGVLTCFYFFYYCLNKYSKNTKKINSISLEWSNKSQNNSHYAPNDPRHI